MAFKMVRILCITATSATFFRLPAPTIRVLCSEYRVVAHRGQSCHVKRVANICASTPNRAVTTHLTRVTIQWSDADQRSDASSAEHSEFRQATEQRSDRGRANASDA